MEELGFELKIFWLVGNSLFSNNVKNDLLTQGRNVLGEHLHAFDL